MSDEIIRRLRSRSAKSVNIIKESFERDKLYEKDEDEEVVNEPGEGTTSSDSEEDEETSEKVEFDDYDLEEEPQDIPDNSTDDYIDPDGNEESELDPGSAVDGHEYINPLDNSYAVKFTIGDEVLLSYSNGTKSKLKGEIDGYDSEGFYRIRWVNGLTTNGITDLAITDILQQRTDEVKCICGSNHFVNEGKYVVCDRCGRKIRENMDVLTIADKSRPKGKKLVRSEAHPVSTVMKPDIGLGEAIRRALKDTESMEQPLSEDRSEYDDEEIHS